MGRAPGIEFEGAVYPVMYSGANWPSSDIPATIVGIANR